MPTQVSQPVTTHQKDDHPVNNDPCTMPCKSALGEDCNGSSMFKSEASDAAAHTKVLPASNVSDASNGSRSVVPDNEPDAEAASKAAKREEEFSGSKAEYDLLVANQWLSENPEILAKVQEVMRKYDAKVYQRSTGSVAPFWRSVLTDLMGKAGHPPMASDDESIASDEKDVPPEGYDEDDGFFAIDLARVVVQMAKFRKNLPRVVPHYAMKCNDSMPMLAMISACGGGFDCASKKEFSTVLDNGFQTTEGIIYAHPCKMINNLQAANRRGVYCCTFDNEEELEKLHKYMPKAKAVLRIATDDSAAQCQFSVKFGCPAAQVQSVLEVGRDLGIDICGVSFHVGSGNGTTGAYFKAIQDARDIFDRAEAMGFKMNLLDIGGGFPGTEPTVAGKLSFEAVAQAIGPMIDELFPPHVRVIAEPGRYFAESPYALAMSIHSKRKVQKVDGTTEYQYYTSDGKYQAFNCMIYDHAKPAIEVLKPDPEATQRITTIFGPTCDGIDWIMQREMFPALDIGDWIFCPDFGAYTVAAGSCFNGFRTRRIEYVTSIDVWKH